MKATSLTFISWLFVQAGLVCVALSGEVFTDQYTSVSLLSPNSHLLLIGMPIFVIGLIGLVVLTAAPIGSEKLAQAYLDQKRRVSVFFSLFLLPITLAASAVYYFQTVMPNTQDCSSLPATQAEAEAKWAPIAERTGVPMLEHYVTRSECENLKSFMNSSSFVEVKDQPSGVRLIMSGLIASVMAFVVTVIIITRARQNLQIN